MRARLPLSLQDLLKEDVADEIRHPKGPNSRDDADDKRLEEIFGRPLHEEVDPMIADMLTTARDFDHWIGEIYADLESGSTLSRKGVNALEHMQRKVDMLIRHLTQLDVHSRKLPG